MIYEENIVQKKIQNIDIRFGLVYPNVYKIAMSSLGYQIIYNLLNDRDDCFCERIIFPNTRSIETNSPSSDFNILSFTIQFEEDYFNLVKILKESNIPLRREDRTDKDPLIIAGGPTVTANPMPIADFVDIFIIGEGENVLSEFLDLYREIPNPHENLDKFLDIESLYIPKFNNKTEISLIEDMDNGYHITYPIIIHTDDKEYTPVFQNAIMLNVSRGCSRGCRFCMSGYLYRPTRETSLEKLIEIAETSRKNSGLNRIALIGPAVSDYSRIDELIESLEERGFEISTPSMRIETITNKSLEYLKKSGLKTLTIAPESIYHLRKRINKDIPDELIDNLIDSALNIGFNLKFYFIIGFPNETKEDIIELKDYIKDIDSRKDKIDHSLSVKFSINPLIPKAQTPLQWDTYNMASIKKKIKYLKKELNGINLKFDSPKLGLKQYILSCGGKDISKLIEKSADENIGIKEWEKHVPQYNTDDKLPWDNIDLGYRKDFLKEEREKMDLNITTEWCQESKCYNCKYNCYY
ncbi:MAG: radical SAM protein [Methanobrevibacter boviskoreani]|jgi:radical SAM superfamily enzyme YgiQ (UPF0313 family)|uniref:radical SAM protein n=1 Tax=Methanobrevibacter TaxID=2172 RepID=UPI000334857F|nr:MULTISPECIES: radical SAM protein [Methanobrevibacter]AGN17176.1 radical SAM domain-containing protein [Methanobrevibacter sp. AbM4]MCI6774547.1 radical SAM protein [Methanobrevibacter boviskoreani]MDY5614064.1 radical SAM protein [Methanobrevibacter boviskoreani]